MRQDRSVDRSSQEVVESVKPETQSVASDEVFGKTSDEAFGKGSGESSADVAAVASLDEPTRRRIYDHVCARALPVSRDEVTEALGIPRRTTAFHLDRLAQLGLLPVSLCARPRASGRGGGAGRAATPGRTPALPPEGRGGVGPLAVSFPRPPGGKETD